MKNKKGFVIFILFFISSISYGQNPYSIEYKEVRGILKSNDKYEKDFGNYHGYELPLFEGENVNFAVFSTDFQPKIILVDPNGKVYKQSPEAIEGAAALLTKIPVSGDWILYVVGGLKDLGQFSLRYAFASANSSNINTNMDLCSSLNFLIAHANAHFMMLPIDELENSGLELIGKNGSVYLDESNKALIIEKYMGADKNDAKRQYFTTLEDISNCVGDWEVVDYQTKDKKNNEHFEGKIFTNKLDRNSAKIFIDLIEKNASTSEKTNIYKVLVTIKQQ